MDIKECYVVYQVEIGKGLYETKETNLMLDIDRSIEDQIRARFPNVVDWKWMIVGDEVLRD